MELYLSFDEEENYEQEAEETNKVLALTKNTSETLCSRYFARECVENVFKTFLFENYMLDLEPFCEKNLKIGFVNPDHVGYFLEKYQFDVFEEFDDDQFEYVGGHVSNIF